MKRALTALPIALTTSHATATAQLPNISTQRPRIDITAFTETIGNIGLNRFAVAL
jgi:hypothetical protein